MPMIAEALNLSRAEVHGVFTFYHDFRHQPAGRHVLKLCRAEACQAAGGDALAARAEAKLGIALGDTTADERVTLEPIYCLGLCATAPSAMLDGRVDRHGSTKRASMRWSRRRSDDAAHLRLPRRRRASRSAPTRSRWRSTRPPRSAASPSRSSAPARAGSFGSSRWSRSRRRKAASPIGPVDARLTSPVRARCDGLPTAAHRAAARRRPTRFPGSSARPA